MPHSRRSPKRDGGPEDGSARSISRYISDGLKRFIVPFASFAMLVYAANLTFQALFWVIGLIFWALSSSPVNPSHAMTPAVPAVTLASSPPPLALRSICSAHHSLSTLHPAYNGVYPTLTDFLGIETHKPPYREAAETDPAHVWEEQRKDILSGWVFFHDRLASRSENSRTSMPLVGAEHPGGGDEEEEEEEEEEREVDEMTRRASSFASRVVVVLQDDHVREMYLHDLLPQIERAGAAAAERVQAEWKKTKKKGVEKGMQDEMERGKRKAMAKWMEVKCVSAGLWPGETGA